MPILPPGSDAHLLVDGRPLPTWLGTRRFTRSHQGKVRDTYVSRGMVDGLTVVATDRVSALDVVLPQSIPRKGEVLTAMTFWWLGQAPEEFRHHLVPSIRDRRFNMAYDLGNTHPGFPVERTLVVEKREILPFELIYRAHLGGSVWKKYLERGIVAGRPLPKDLAKWSKLSKPLFTPSTKAQEGHDVNITQQKFFRETGREGRDFAAHLGRFFEWAYGVARERGIVILDTKFEGDGEIICDEVLTPDSSRFTSIESLEQAVAAGDRDPEFMDKEPVRVWLRLRLKELFGSIDAFDPKNPEHVARVQGLEMPSEVVAETSERYLKIFERLTGKPLDQFQEEDMGVAKVAA